jgi:hypothetical protein
MVMISNEIYRDPLLIRTYKGRLKPFTDDDLRLLKSKIEEILGEPKYVKMAQLAELLQCSV